MFCLLPWVGLQCVVVEFPDHTTSFAVILMEKRELGFFYFNCLPDVLLILVFCGCRGLVCSVCLWNFLIILTCFAVILMGKRELVALF